LLNGFVEAAFVRESCAQVGTNWCGFGMKLQKPIVGIDGGGVLSGLLKLNGMAQRLLGGVILRERE
jgi:hypothetical protein